MMVCPGAQIGGGNYEKLLGQGAKALVRDSIPRSRQTGQAEGRQESIQASNRAGNQPISTYIFFCFCNFLKQFYAWTLA